MHEIPMQCTVLRGNSGTSKHVEQNATTADPPPVAGVAANPCFSY